MISFCGWWSQMRSSLHPFSPVPVSAHDVLGKAAAPRKRHPPCPPLKGGRKKWITLTLVYKCCPGLTSHGYPSPALPELISCQVFSILSPLLPPPFPLPLPNSTCILLTRRKSMQLLLPSVHPLHRPAEQKTLAVFPLYPGTFHGSPLLSE